MATATESRRWKEEKPAAPADLRLVPAAMAIWAGALIGLLSGDIAWWVAGIALLSGPAIRFARVRWQSGWLVILVCLAGSTVVAALHVGQQRDDPLSESAEHGSWATLAASVTGFPRAVDSGFVAPDDGNAALKDDSRWRVDVTVELATVAGRSWSSTAAVTIHGKGLSWSGVTPGERIVVSGRMGEQAFGSTQQIVLHARDPPVVTDAAPWWHTVALIVRKHLSDNASRLAGDAVGLLPGLAT